MLTINKLALGKDLVNGDILTLEIEDFELVTSISGTLSANTYPVTAGAITITSAGTMRLLSADSLDTNTIRLNFSDYITNVGNFSFDNGLSSTSAEIDSQDSTVVIVYTSTQIQ